MSSQTQTFENSTRTENTLSIGKRLLWIAIGWAIQLIYLPTSEWFTGGVQPKLPIDIFPLWPVWVIPYVLCYPLWFAGFAWAAFKMSDRMFRGLRAGSSGHLLGLDCHILYLPNLCAGCHTAWK